MTKGLYLHIPFCKKKCNYCSFYSDTRLTKKDDFFEALNKEISYKRNLFEDFFKERGEVSLYIGGGNPALLNEKDLEKLFNLLGKLSFSFQEITIELNPENVTINKLKVIRSLGVNRISLGIQSFCDEVLSFLGRDHDRSITIKVLEDTANLFENYSIDLIGGISAVRRDWSLEFEYLKTFLPPHISFYLLSVEAGTEFYNKIIVDEDLQHKEYYEFCNFADVHGYEHYEVSNFCRDGRYANHNLLYWNGNDYLAFGPSAASFLKRENLRLKNVSNLDDYIKNPKDFYVERLTEKDAFLETLFLSLRTAVGISRENLKLKFPLFYKMIEGPIDDMKSNGYLVEHSGNLFIPEKYMLIMNEIILNIVKEI